MRQRKDKTGIRRGSFWAGDRVNVEKPFFGASIICVAERIASFARCQITNAHFACFYFRVNQNPLILHIGTAGDDFAIFGGMSWKSFLAVFVKVANTRKFLVKGFWFHDEYIIEFSPQRKMKNRPANLFSYAPPLGWKWKPRVCRLASNRAKLRSSRGLYSISRLEISKRIQKLVANSWAEDSRLIVTSQEFFLSIWAVW